MNISGKTKICMIIGDPVDHSLSPVMHNIAYQRLNIDDKYVFTASKVKKEDLKQVINSVRVMNIKGVSCTMPHKQNVMQYLDNIDPIAKKIGAVNTIVNNNGNLSGYNTDWYGVLAPLAEYYDSNITDKFLIRKKIGIIGAGGATRAVVYAILQAGGTIEIYNRSINNARILKKEVNNYQVADITIYSLDEIKNIKEVDIIINTTSIGMGALINQTPVPLKYLKSSQIVFDIVYEPKFTKLLIDAKSIGANCITGSEMLLHQGIKQFELFTGVNRSYAGMKYALSREIKDLGKVIKAIIFDFDGTMFTLNDLPEQLIEKILRKHNIDIDINEYKSMEGRSHKVRLMHYLGDNYKSIFDEFNHRYKDLHKNKMIPFPGIIELLYKLKKQGIKLFIYSAKEEKLINVVLKKYKLIELFDGILGTGKLNPKSDTKVIKILQNQLGINNKEILLIGDSEIDELTARQARVRFCFAKWGTKYPELIKHYDYKANNPSEILQLVNRFNSISDNKSIDVIKKIERNHFKIRICGVVTGNTIEEFKFNLEKIQKRVNIVELRVDYIQNFNASMLEEIIKRTYRETILTCRVYSNNNNSGFFQGSHKEQLRIYQKADELKVDYIDIEKEEYKQSQHTFENSKLILSHHFWNKSADLDLLKLTLKQMRNLKPDVIKIVNTVQDDKDNINLIKVLLDKKENEDMIVLGMGEKATFTRTFFPLIHGFLTYASVNESISAPGQLAVKTLKAIYHLLGYYFI